MSGKAGGPRVTAEGASDKGKRRPDNQDAWRAEPASGLFLVADGMGGMSGGAIASKAVAELLPGRIAAALAALPRRTEAAVEGALKDALAAFSAELRDRAKATPGLSGMGATVVLALVEGRRLYVANLGDSRAYLLEAGRLKRLTKDHSLVAVLLEFGKITAEEAERHPSRHVVSRYVGMDGKAAADVRRVRLRREARLLLCTDGLTNMVKEDAIQAVLADSGGGAAAKLVELANAAGGEDNVTALVVDLTH